MENKSYIVNLSLEETYILLIGKRVSYMGDNGLGNAHLVAIKGKDMFFKRNPEIITEEGFWVINCHLILTDWDFGNGLNNIKIK